MRISDWSSDVCSSDLRDYIEEGKDCNDTPAHDVIRLSGGYMAGDPFREQRRPKRRSAPISRGVDLSRQTAETAEAEHTRRKPGIARSSDFAHRPLMCNAIWIRL